ncbi:MAG: glucokinase [Paracoccus sp. (in: a-proteobacteria)]|nr:glucokinase [Paracoccus sp. (in: a-proteobacteria)]
MATLLADVGGTNARLALARDGVIAAGTVSRYLGEDYAQFDAVVRHYLSAQGSPQIEAVCVAVAGPVTGGEARLTNRDWSFSEAGLARLTTAPRVRLINDLTALGYATAGLAGDGVGLLRAAPEGRARNGQALVVGAGTGFNVCAVRNLPGGAVSCSEAEEGHTSLPANIADRLRARVGDAAMAGFFSTEETFAGRGLARLHQAMHGLHSGRPEEIFAAARAGDARAGETYGLFTELFGLMLRELALRFMPLEGMYLAGSVARSFADRRDVLEAAFLAESYMRHIPANTPLILIRDDMAALQGCLTALE